ncbi:uncharacterized protein LOC135200418 [Macrobrachium nipponense]|uniref:uncharacterized protein LOC135200418 n=1 Tax=Macrobrachium nipponense TaxID=159736 RepID=UPI0030C81FB4
MRTLVTLAVMGLCSALPYQASYSAFPSYFSYSGAYQPTYLGPLAPSFPAGVHNGQLFPVSDTYEASAARQATLDAYQRQVAAVGAFGRLASVYNNLPHSLVHAPGQAYSTAPYGQAIPSSPVVVRDGFVQDAPEVAAAKAQLFALYNQRAAAAPGIYPY